MEPTGDRVRLTSSPSPINLNQTPSKESKASTIFQEKVSPRAEDRKPLLKPVVPLKSPYPYTPKKPTENIYHGTVVIDNYQWLEDAENPEVKEWEKLQTEYTQNYLRTNTSIQPLIDHYLPLLFQGSYEPPMGVYEGTRTFSYKRLPYQDQKVCTMHNDGVDTEVLNPNLWPGKYVNYWSPSRDGKYLAIGVSSGGNEDTRIHILDIDNKTFLPDTTKGWRQHYVKWPLGNEGFFYSASPLKGEVPDKEEKYWKSVYYHKLGTSSEQDVKVFFSDNKEDYHWTHISDDGDYVIFDRLTIGNNNELYFKKIDSDTLIPLATGFDGDYTAIIVEDQILIQTDFGAPMYQVFKTSVNKPSKENWQVLIPEDPSFKITSISPGNKKLYVTGLHNACSVIKIFNLDGVFLRELKLPTHGTASVSGTWDDEEIYVDFESFLYPEENFTYDYDKDILTSVYKKLFPIDTSNYVLKQVWVTSKDGTQISMFVMHRKDIKLDGNNPAIITGYGGFNTSKTPTFLLPVIPWIEHGGVCAIANLRGGGEYGKEWHDAGKGLNKQNVFDDFIAASEWLINNKLTNPKRLASYGASNGGLLVAAAMTQRPDLYQAVFCAVPLLDMLRYEEFDFAEMWNEEYGSVKDPQGFHALHSYSPYHRVEDNTDYPTIMIAAAENDTRVNPGPARKMAARMQAANPNGRKVLFYLAKKTGHMGAPSLIDSKIQELQYLGFLINATSMEVPEESFFRRADIYSSVAGMLFRRFVGEPAKRIFSSQPSPWK